AGGLVRLDRGASHCGGTAVDELLCPAGLPVALGAYRVELVDDLRFGEKASHRAERPSPEILVESRDDDLPARVGELVKEIDDVVLEEVDLVDRDDFDRFADGVADLMGAGHGYGREGSAIARGDPERRDFRVPGGISEGGNSLAGDQSTAHATAKLFRFAALHAADNDFDPTGIRVCMHSRDDRSTRKRVPCHPTRSRAAVPIRRREERNSPVPRNVR